MKSDETKSATETSEADRLGYRRANHAALYANLRTFIARTLVQKNPVVGFHGIQMHESGEYQYLSAGGSPDPITMLGAIGGWQGFVISMAVARQLGDRKAAHMGDQYNVELGRTQCLNCDDGDPKGDHAAQEVAENGRAWLGLVITVAQEFYGKSLTPRARELLTELMKESMPIDTQVS